LNNLDCCCYIHPSFLPPCCSSGADTTWTCLEVKACTPHPAPSWVSHCDTVFCVFCSSKQRDLIKSTLHSLQSSACPLALRRSLLLDSAASGPDQSLQAPAHGVQLIARPQVSVHVSKPVHPIYRSCIAKMHCKWPPFLHWGDRPNDLLEKSSARGAQQNEALISASLSNTPCRRLLASQSA